MSKKKDLWMPLYVGDYLGDTGHLTTAQHGAYLLLMMHYWRKGELPSDDKQLAAITKLPVRLWLDCKETLQAFFYDGWRHKRIDAELAKRAEVSERRAAAGYKGGMRAQMNRMVAESNCQPSAKQLLPRSTQQTATNVGAIASNLLGVCSSKTQSHKNITTTVSVERGLGKGSIEVSPELVASLGRRGT